MREPEMTPAAQQRPTPTPAPQQKAQ